MRTKALYFWEELKSSFWLVPLVLIIAGIALSIGCIALDEIIKPPGYGWWRYILTAGAESARSVLTLIAGAMLGMASTVFSITLVALTLASSQFGPRLLRNFMYDRLNQVVLGSYIATFIYCLMVLNSVKSEDDFGFIPHWSILFALVLAIANTALLIVFIHHISIGIQADKVIADTGERLQKGTFEIFPFGLGSESGKEGDGNFTIRELITAPVSGYIQAIDGPTLMGLACRHNLQLELLHRPGSFMVEKQALIHCFGEKTCAAEVKKAIAGAFILGDVRTPAQDPEFAIHQTVEIACRALSPGINDPYTAIACIDSLTATICKLAGEKFPSARRFDEKGTLRIIAQPMTFEGVLGAAFNQIRHYAAANPVVLIRVMDGLSTIYGFVKTEAHEQAIWKHAHMVMRAAENNFTEPTELEEMRRMYSSMVEAK